VRQNPFSDEEFQSTQRPDLLQSTPAASSQHRNDHRPAAGMVSSVMGEFNVGGALCTKFAVALVLVNGTGRPGRPNAACR
jgi:predicted trehalose synthase